MKILIDIQGMQSRSKYRGIGRITYEFVKHVIQNKGEHEVQLLANLSITSRDEIYEQFYDILPLSNIKFISVVGDICGYGESVQNNRAASCEVYSAFVENLKPDVFHISSCFEGSTDNSIVHIVDGKYPLVKSAMIYDIIPYLYQKDYLSNFQDKSIYYRNLDVLKKQDMLLSISDHAKTDFAQHFNFSEKNIFPVYTGVSDIFVHSDAILANAQFSFKIITKNFIYYISEFDVRKNFKGLVEAYAQLPLTMRNEYQLVLTCGTNEAVIDSIYALAKSLNLLEEDVVCTGRISDEMLLQLYKNCALFVFPSWYEGFGIPIVEAMCCNAPVIASNTSSMIEVVNCFEALFDPLNSRDMARVIERALTDKSFRDLLIENGQKRKNAYSWDKTAKLGITAWEQFFNGKNRECICNNTCKSKLAFISPINHLTSDVTAFNSHFLPELSLFFDITVISSQKTCDDPWISGNLKVKTLDWFTNNGHDFDYIVYNICETCLDDSYLSLIDLFQGVILLHDINFCQPIKQCTARNRKNIIPAKIYKEYGYYELKKYFNSSSNYHIDKQNLGELIARSLGVIVTSDDTKDVLRKSEYAQGYNINVIDVSLVSNVDWRKVSLDLRDVILNSYAVAKKTAFNVANSVINSFDIDSNMLDIDDFARVVDRCFPPNNRKKQIFVDVTIIRNIDFKTGIQRIVKKLLYFMIENPPAGYRIEPVYCEPSCNTYLYDRKYASYLLNFDDSWAINAPVECYPGDIFLGLDWNLDVPHVQPILTLMKEQGVKIYFVVYDMLPYLQPHHFVSDLQGLFEPWLKMVYLFDGIIAESKTVLDECRAYYEMQCHPRSIPFYYNYFHNGCDFIESINSKYSTANANVLAKIKNTNSFLMVSTVESRKGHAQVLSAFEILWRDGFDVTLVIVGKAGWLVDSLLKKMRAHPERNKRLIWLQGIDDDYLAAMYNNCSAYIMASEGEGFGLGIIEATRFGLPLILRDIPVFREVAGNNALYFTGMKAEDIAEALCQWMVLKEKGKLPLSKNIVKLTWKESAAMLLNALPIDRCCEIKSEVGNHSRVDVISAFSNTLGRMPYSEEEIIKSNFCCDNLSACIEKSIENQADMLTRSSYGVFLHINKACGTSLHDILSKNYCDYFWIPNDNFSVDTTMGQAKFFGGHRGYLDFFNIKRNFLFLSVIRNPVDLAFSLHNYWSTHDVWLNENGVKEYPWYFNEDSLKDTLMHGPTWHFLNNFQCRWISGYSSFDAALEVLERENFILGCTDYFNEFVDVCSNLLNWQHKSVPYLNKASASNYQEKYLQETDLVNILTDQNQEDFKLYEYVKSKIVLNTVKRDFNILELCANSESNIISKK